MTSTRRPDLVRDYGGVAVVGLALGFALSRIGFSSWDEVHAMFTFRSFRLMLVFVSALVLLTATWIVVKRFRKPDWRPRPFHEGSIPGGILFGVGWAVSGACPGIALVSLGEGQLAAIATLIGLFAGNLSYGVVHRRWLRWHTQSCLDD